MSMRMFVLAAGCLLARLAPAQARIDSVHVFKQVPPGAYTSASANAMAWQLHRSNAAYSTVKGGELAALTEALQGYTPGRHTFAPLPGLTHLAMAYAGGRLLAFGVADDMDLVIDFTARTEYRISSFADRLRVRAVLVKVLLME
ncbi:MAG: hypothetical protein JST66_02000 [Bacteroidetes bacterium]|nr:hypothetical protein [Bacteroidota bacterium]